MCDQCSRRFRFPWKLREHVDAVHLKKKPYKCRVEECDWVTGFATNVGVHMRKIHGYQVKKPGRPKSEIVEQFEEGKEFPQDDNGEEQKLEIKNALILEVRKHPLIWDIALSQKRRERDACKEDWVEIWTCLERAFTNNIHFHNMFPRDVKVFSKYTKVPLTYKEASIKKMRCTWQNLVQRHKKIMKKSSTFGAHGTDGTDDNPAVDWPFFDSFKFLSDVTLESSNEPQIFKDVRKYVLKCHNESEA